LLQQPPAEIRRFTSGRTVVLTPPEIRDEIIRVARTEIKSHEIATARRQFGLDLDDWQIPYWLAEQKVLTEEPPLAKPGITLYHADKLRAKAWSATYAVGQVDVDDWKPVTKSYAPRVIGACRHKASWLKQQLGGKLIFGYRVDRVETELHCALLIRIDGKDCVLDYDRVWHADQYPLDHVDRLAPQPRKAAPAPKLIEELGHKDKKLKKLEKMIEHLEKLERLPTMKYVGIWKDGTGYLPGECVTYGGNIWHCKKGTSAKPKDDPEAWVLACKKGRDGRDGMKGDKGQTKSDPGRRDLTKGIKA
jgi:hypothetical protein